MCCLSVASLHYHYVSGASLHSHDVRSSGMQPGHLIWVEDAVPKARLMLRRRKCMGVVLHVGEWRVVVQRLLEDARARDEPPLHLHHDSNRLRILRPCERSEWHGRLVAHGPLTPYEVGCFGTQL